MSGKAQYFNAYEDTVSGLRWYVGPLDANASVFTGNQLIIRIRRLYVIRVSPKSTPSPSQERA